ncbi:MJ1255/VC2487 family glycosyltransferase [Marinagarivorans algicola]|uniref:MJ1255/VC2487 family glycosyltransferase n=1 Tax=Marinagarivorans algicola TaxID=1513270 RepID=UPI0006B54C12|nr:MJ1255/VC2487 family glycosyltransferase [Marinagarivorans algicola]
MKILYGVQATGNGHITRARALAKQFARQGIEVDYLFSGRAADKFFDMEPFGQWQCKRGLTFIHEAGQLNIPKTLRQNSLKTLYNDIRALDLSPYDLVLTDFEPITAWAARKKQKTCIGVGHQYAFYKNVPRRGDNVISRAIMRHFAPADIHLGLHWHHFGQPILPPIAEVHENNHPIDNNKILVYLGFEAHDDIVQMIEPFKSHLFVIYGPYPRYQSHENIQFKPLSREGFQQDLATCNGVICNAGFELASEAIQLGKKLLVKPLHGQMEQLSNAKALELLNIGMTMNSLNSRTVKGWLDNFEAKQVHYPNVAEAIVEWLQHSNLQDTHILAEQLWAQVTSPHMAVFNQSIDKYQVA